METVLLHKSAFLYVTSIFRLSSFVFANALLTGITKTFVPFYSSFPEILRKPVLDKKGQVTFDEDGNLMYELDEVVVPFFEAVTRANLGLPIIDKDYRKSEGWQFLFSMKQNEYFVFPNEKTGFNPKEVDLLNPDNYAMISPNLFRVQTMSKVMYGNNVVRDYKFRHHLETTVKDMKELKDIAYKQYKTLSFGNSVVKIRINHIGQIVSVGEY